MSVISPSKFEALAGAFSSKKGGIFAPALAFTVVQLCRAVADLQRKASYEEPSAPKLEPLDIQAERERLAALREHIDNLKKETTA